MRTDDDHLVDVLSEFAGTLLISASLGEASTVVSDGETGSRRGAGESAMQALSVCSVKPIARCTRSRTAGHSQGTIDMRERTLNDGG